MGTVMDNLFLFTGNGFLIEKNLNSLRKKLDIQMEELNVSVFKDMPSVDELIGVSCQVPFMSEKRLVVCKDLSLLSPKSSKEEGKKLSDYLDKLPDTTVLIMCYMGSPDKRRTLYKQIKKMGSVYDYPEPKADVCIKFAIDEAKKNDASIKRPAAELLVNTVGCDYFSIENEIAKLAVFTQGKEIKQEHVKLCASKSLEYNVFEMHNLLVSKKADKAFSLLEEILFDGRPEALIGLIAYNLREMYKVRAMLDASFSESRIAKTLKTRDFIVRRRIRECRGFKSKELREGLSRLSELDYSIKSGKQDPKLGLHDTLIKIYKL